MLEIFTASYRGAGDIYCQLQGCWGYLLPATVRMVHKALGLSTEVHAGEWSDIIIIIIIIIIDLSITIDWTQLCFTKPPKPHTQYV